MEKITTTRLLQCTATTFPVQTATSRKCWLSLCSAPQPKGSHLSQVQSITPLSSFTSLFQLCVKDHQEQLCTVGHSHVW